MNTEWDWEVIGGVVLAVAVSAGFFFAGYSIGLNDAVDEYHKVMLSSSKNRTLVVIEDDVFACEYIDKASTIKGELP